MLNQKPRRSRGAGLRRREDRDCQRLELNSDGTNCLSHDPIPGADASRPDQLTPEQARGQEADRQAGRDPQCRYLLHGTGLAEKLALAGHEVTIVTGAPGQLHALHARVSEHDAAPARAAIKELHNTFGSASAGQARDLRHLWGRLETHFSRRRQVSARCQQDPSLDRFDSLLLVTGRHSNDSLHRQLKDQKPKWAENGVKAVYVIGDAEAPR